eukprot:TRINITY_DN33785_c0_g1_i1.p1 TRINITY_DN33785_c0_g1~~TRINITY_DN33785_c0_g1_i1.p1  ORF type:complete len:308 (-),score=113.99 TRINITY_DN33785_c0_g1_i1:135-1058(-)
MAPKKPDPKDFMLMNKKGEKILREPGSLMGYDMLIDGCEDCEIRLLDRTSQVQVDYCKRSKILIGPVGGSVFVRNCEDCVIFAACQQLRTRECKNCDFVLLIPGTPIIETSVKMRFGPLPEDLYAELPAQMSEQKLSIPKNDWSKIYDFSPDNPPGGDHWSLLEDAQTEALLKAFPAKPEAAGAAGKADDAAAAAGGDEPTEIRVTLKKPAGFYKGAAKAFLQGLPEKDGKPAKAAVKRISVSGLGEAVAAAAAVAASLEHEGVAKISSISTDYVDLPKRADEAQGEGSSDRQRKAARLLVFLAAAS